MHQFKADSGWTNQWRPILILVPNLYTTTNAGARIKAFAAQKIMHQPLQFLKHYLQCLYLHSGKIVTIIQNCIISIFKDK